VCPILLIATFEETPAWGLKKLPWVSRKSKSCRRRRPALKVCGSSAIDNEKPRTEQVRATLTAWITRASMPYDYNPLRIFHRKLLSINSVTFAALPNTVSFSMKRLKPHAWLSLRSGGLMSS
jgi:hypothetical protein